MKWNGRIILPVIWVALVAALAIRLVRYETTPGVASAQPAPVSWPSDAGFARDAKRLELVMFLHPQCPCSRATLHELSQVMSRTGGNLDVRVFVVAPHNAPEDFARGPLFQQAEGIGGVSVTTDTDGRLARIFAATTSGDVSVYGKDGRLLFKGGITDGRGHEGDNDGLDAVLAIVLGRQPAVRQTAVFGCPLED